MSVNNEIGEGQRVGCCIVGVFVCPQELHERCSEDKCVCEI